MRGLIRKIQRLLENSNLRERFEVNQKNDVFSQMIAISWQFILLFIQPLFILSICKSAEINVN